MRRQSAWKRLCAVLLSAAMVMGSSSFAVLAEETVTEESAAVTEVAAEAPAASEETVAEAPAASEETVAEESAAVMEAAETQAAVEENVAEETATAMEAAQEESAGITEAVSETSAALQEQAGETAPAAEGDVSAEQAEGAATAVSEGTVQTVQEENAEEAAAADTGEEEIEDILVIPEETIQEDGVSPDETGGGEEEQIIGEDAEDVEAAEVTVSEELAEVISLATDNTENSGGFKYATELSIGEEITVTIEREYATRYFKITPAETKYYIFTSSNNTTSSGSNELETYAELYDSDSKEIYGDDLTGDDGDNLNFEYGYLLEAGSIYYLRVSAYEAGTFCLTATITDCYLQYDSYVSIVPGGIVTLSVTAKCPESVTPSYQWVDKSGSISGATGDSYEVSGLTNSDSYDYCCVVTMGSVTQTAYFTVGVYNKLTVSYQSTHYVSAGGTATLTVTASCAKGELTYTWYDSNGNKINGKTGASYTVSLSNEVESEKYKCIVSDEYGEEKTAEFQVFLTDSLKLSYESEYEVAYDSTEGVIIYVEAVSPNEIISYTWKNENGETLAATGNSLTILPTNAGKYSCIVTDGTTTETASITVSVNSGLEVLPDTWKYYAVKSGEVGPTLTVTATSDAAKEFTYTWQRSETDEEDLGWYTIDGETSSSYQVPASTTAERSYRCIVNDGYDEESALFEVRILAGDPAASVQAAVDLSVGDSIYANIAEADTSMYFKIVPATSGKYEFRTLDADTFAYLFDEDLGLLTKDVNYYYGEGGNTDITCSLEEGKTYYLEAGYRNRNCVGSFLVSMEFYTEDDEDDYTEDDGECMHEKDDGTVTKAATCTATGVRTYKCINCGTTMETETIPTIAHVKGAGTVTKAATCTEVGTIVYKCTKCGQVMESAAIAATGQHTWSAWTTASTATVFKAETQTRSCSVCGGSETRTVGSKLKKAVKLNVSGTIPAKLGQSFTVKASGLAAGDSIASWKSSNTKVATVKNGKITATKTKKMVGKTATITVTTKAGAKASFKVKVQKGDVATSKITGLKKSVTVKKGKTLKLTPTVTPITSKNKLTYKSSNKKVATVSSKGVIKGVKAGTAKITVQSGKKKVTVTVKVQGVKTKSITNVKAKLTLKKGKSTTLKPKLKPSNSTDTITYSSSNKKVATVSAKGKITAKKAGTATITVKSGSKKVTCKVTVTK